MGRQKLIRYQEVKSYANFYDEFTAPKARWSEIAFKNNQPIILELGCGNGEYVVNLAKQHATKNFIGLDIKTERLCVGLREVKQLGIENAAFLKLPVQFLPEFFAENEVDELWITFPDPFLKGQKQRKRLCSSYFLGVYRQVLKNGGIVNFKTDCDPLFEYTEQEVFPEQGNSIEILYKTYDLHNDPSANPEWLIKTKYESLYIKKDVPIKFVQFKLFK